MGVGGDGKHGEPWLALSSDSLVCTRDSFSCISSTGIPHKFEGRAISREKIKLNCGFHHSNWSHLRVGRPLEGTIAEGVNQSERSSCTTREVSTCLARSSRTTGESPCRMSSTNNSSMLEGGAVNGNKVSTTSSTLVWDYARAFFSLEGTPAEYAMGSKGFEEPACSTGALVCSMVALVCSIETLVRLTEVLI